jgi:arylsulfatase A-like enzyme
VSGNPYSQYDYTLNENGKLVSYGHTPQDYGTDVYAKKANDFIRNSIHDKKPFFLYLAVYAPHSPATPAPRHQAMFADATIPKSKAYNEADVSTKPDFVKKLPPLTAAQIKIADQYYGRRLASLQAVDEAIAGIYKTLSDAHELDNTYIVFTSDNGFHLGEHRLNLGKQTAYETDIHLPFFVRGPGVEKGSTAQELVGNIDLAPTFAAIAQASVPDFVDGRSLLPILHNSQVNPPWRPEFLVEHWQRQGQRNHPNTGELSPLSQHTRLASYGREDLAEISEGKDEGIESKPQGRQGTKAILRRFLKNGSADPTDYRNELAHIPAYEALRDHDSLYVEYRTGEKEFYRLSEDCDEINNIWARPKAQTDVFAKSHDLNRLKEAGKP